MRLSFFFISDYSEARPTTSLSINGPRIIPNMAEPNKEPVELWRHSSPETTQMWYFKERVEKKYGVKLEGYRDLYNWSIENIGDFWREMCLFTGVHAKKTGTQGQIDASFDQVSLFSRDVKSWFVQEVLNERMRGRMRIYVVVFLHHCGFWNLNSGYKPEHLRLCQEEINVPTPLLKFSHDHSLIEPLKPILATIYKQC